MTINKPNNTESQTRKFKLAPDYAGTEPRVAHDFEQANALMLQLDIERVIEENPLVVSSDWESLNVFFFLLLLHFPLLPLLLFLFSPISFYISP
jgi:hypothetical protein